LLMTLIESLFAMISSAVSIASTKLPCQAPDIKQINAVGKCCICLDTKKHCDLLTLPCKHIYCTECTQTSIKAAIMNPKLVPLRCCQREFPDEYVKQNCNPVIHSQYTVILKTITMRDMQSRVGNDYQLMLDKFGYKACANCGIGIEKVSGCGTMLCRWYHPYYER